MSTAMLLMDWKQEPVSPLSSEEAQSSEDATLYANTLERYTPKVEWEFATCESKAEVASKLLEGLEQLENLDDFIKIDFDEWIKNGES